MDLSGSGIDVKLKEKKRKKSFLFLLGRYTNAGQLLIIFIIVK